MEQREEEEVVGGGGFTTIITRTGEGRGRREEKFLEMLRKN